MFRGSSTKAILASCRIHQTNEAMSSHVISGKTDGKSICIMIPCALYNTHDRADYPTKMPQEV